MTLAEALRELGSRKLYARNASEAAPAWAWAGAFVRRSQLRRKVKITPEGIALPNGQLLYRFADSEPGGKTR